MGQTARAEGIWPLRAVLPTMEVVAPTTRKIALTILFSAAALCVPAVAHAAHSTPDRQEVVTVKRYTLGRVKPKIGARGLVHLWTNTGYSNRKAVYPVVEHRMVGESEWLRVRVVRRPREITTWIPAWVTRKHFIGWRITVDLSQRRATVTRLGSVARRFRVVVGAKSTPTPTGHYFVVDHMRLHNSWARGGWALATSAYSAVLKHFDGGDGVIALHAKGALTAPLGTAASHGCVRFADASIAWMADHLPNGTPVDIQR